ncbi:YdeI family protein [Myxosarcina sp. GI1]|uniref:YdeI/OmpD-associated family protein n=1 Tax=Myxosarcina sp. GI1 TaxID=1541065 RepID=UPI00056BC954|nr:YdeI/OmpD-associated family protein [Myxosarcina sp. GI1]
MVKPVENAKQIIVKTRQDLRNWLQQKHLQTEGIWLVTYKKNHQYYLPYNDIVEECLCFGWVDSLPRKLDEKRTMLYLAPRRQGSNWSKANKERVDRLIKNGLMQPAGLTKVDRAKKDGSWSFLDDVEALILPEDLKIALSTDRAANMNFNAFPPSTKRGILEWIKNAKKPETRAKRILETVEKAAQNIRANY